VFASPATAKEDAREQDESDKQWAAGRRSGQYYPGCGLVVTDGPFSAEEAGSQAPARRLGPQGPPNRCAGSMNGHIVAPFRRRPELFRSPQPITGMPRRAGVKPRSPLIAVVPPAVSHPIWTPVPAPTRYAGPGANRNRELALLTPGQQWIDAQLSVPPGATVFRGQASHLTA
jgi:hypothetical protein